MSVAICNGSDCRKRAEHADLERCMGRVADVTAVRCLGLCASPVAVVLDAGGNHAVFERVRTPKQRRDLARLISGGGRPSRRLAKRRVVGARRRKVLARLARRTRRLSLSKPPGAAAAQACSLREGAAIAGAAIGNFETA